MRQFKLSKYLAITSIAIITIIFLAGISPLKGFGFYTPLILLSGIFIWVASLILLIVGFSKNQKDKNKLKGFISTLILVIGFIPIGFIYTAVSGYVRTKITVNITNQSDYIPKDIKIYGVGDIFENSDTLKMNKLIKGEKLKYIIRPSTRPFRKGYIRMEFDVSDKHFSKDIAGEFSINPYIIQQYWEFTLDNEFVK